MSEGDQDTHEAALTPSASAKDEMRRWVERWKVVGPLLEAERWARLSGATDAALQRQAWDLLALWQPGVAGDDGEAIVRQQRVFARLGNREVV